MSVMVGSINEEANEGCAMM